MFWQMKKPDGTEPTPDELDEAFFRKFQNADKDVKAKLKRILDVLDDEE